MLLKDNIDTADSMQTSAGSLALVDSGVERDSWVAARLRAAGAVLIGKTNLSEWANFRSRRSTSGWSGRGGLTLNPYALDRNPCGSSSGSAVAVSAGLVPLSIGTETNGSIVCPASINGIVGIKPTVGLVGRSGIVPIAHTQDTAGPMARTVEDAAAMLGPLTGNRFPGIRRRRTPSAELIQTTPCSWIPRLFKVRALDCFESTGDGTQIWTRYSTAPSMGCGQRAPNSWILKTCLISNRLAGPDSR